MSKTVRYKSQKQEQSVAKQIGGKTTIASGSFWGMKADVRSEDFLVECKTTSKNYFPVTAKIWEKIEKEAIRDRLRIPLLIVDIGDGEERYVVFRPNDFNLSTYGFLTLQNIPKSFRVSLGLLGYNFYSGYKQSLTVCIKDSKINTLCVMLVNDFEEVLKNWR